MKNFNFSKTIIIALLIVIAASTAISLTAQAYQKNASPNTLMKVINDGAGGVDQLFTAPGSFIQSQISGFQNTLNANTQNQSLKKQLTQLQDQNQKLQSALAENQQLKAALKLTDTLSNYTTVTANVITRNPSSWNNVLVIDKGAANGLKSNMIIMANGGIVGRLTQVNDTTAKVALLIGTGNLDNKIPVQIGNSYGLLQSYDSTKGYYVVTNITTSDSFKKGDNVVTSGLGGDSPSNLMLGTIVGQSGQNSDASRKIYVQPSANFHDLSIVTVVERQIEGS